MKNDKKVVYGWVEWVVEVGYSIRNPMHTIFSNTVSYTKLDFPTKFYQNRAKIAKVSHLRWFLGAWAGWFKHGPEIP